MVRWFRRCAALRSDVSEARFLPGPRRAVLETGDIGGDKLSGLTRYVEEPLGSTSAGCRVRRWLTLGCAIEAAEPASLFQAFCALFGPKERAVTKR